MNKYAVRKLTRALPAITRLSKQCSALLLTLTVVGVESTQAQTQYRQYQSTSGWQAGFVVDNQGSESISNKYGAQAELSSNTGWGGFVGYRFDDNLALDFDMVYNNPKYRVSFIDADNNPREISNRSSNFSANFNLTYTFSDGITFGTGYPRVKPFIRGGLGWVNIDSNISNGQSYCRPDYYWGWYCYQSSYSTTDFTYNAGLGLTMDLNRTTFLRLSYGRQWIDMSNGTSDAELDRTKLELGFKY